MICIRSGSIFDSFFCVCVVCPLELYLIMIMLPSPDLITYTLLSYLCKFLCMFGVC